MKAARLINSLLEDDEDLLMAVRDAGFTPTGSSVRDFVSIGIDQITSETFAYVAVAVKSGDGYAIRIYSETGNVTSKFFGEPPRGVTRYDMAYASTVKDAVDAIIRVRDAANLERAEKLSGLSDELKSVNENQDFELLAEESERLASELRALGYRAVTNFKPDDAAGGLTMCVVLLLSPKDDFDFKDGSVVVTRYQHEGGGIRIALLDRYHTVIGKTKVNTPSASEIDSALKGLIADAADDSQDIADEIRGEL
jgi:hypothetical protein